MEVKMRYALIAAWLLLIPCAPAVAQLSINFGSPGVNIGINLGAYPTLQRVPGYPVYYAPGVNSNYFFYDGLYWVYDADNWYASSWYNGPWRMVGMYDVPPYVLRIPVRYYRHAPAYFHGWSVNDAPRWGDHWGQEWQQRRSGWDQWNRKSAPAPAPLPTYQRQYSGTRYPQSAQQAVIETRDYRYQPKDPVAQQHFEYRRTEAKSAPPQPQAAPVQHAQPQHTQQPAPQHQEAAARPQQQAAPKPQQQTQPQHQQQQAAPVQPVQRQQPSAQAPKPQRTEPKPQPEAAQHVQKAPQPQAEHKAPQPQAQQRAPQPQAAPHEQRAPQPQAEHKAPQAKEPGKGAEKDNKEKGQEH
jgi:hypothetical protein